MTEGKNIDRMTEAIVLRSDDEGKFSIPQRFTNLLDSPRGLVIADSLNEKEFILGIPRSGLYCLCLTVEDQYSLKSLLKVLEKENATILFTANTISHPTFGLYLQCDCGDIDRFDASVRELAGVKESILTNLDTFDGFAYVYHTRALILNFSEDSRMEYPNETEEQSRNLLAIYERNKGNLIQIIPIEYPHVFAIRTVSEFHTGRDYFRPDWAVYNIVYTTGYEISSGRRYGEYYLEASSVKEEIAKSPEFISHQILIEDYLSRRSGCELIEVQDITIPELRDVPASYLGIVNMIREVLYSSDYKNTIDELGISEFSNRIINACTNMSEAKRYWYQRAILEELRLHYLTGFDGNLMDYFHLVPAEGSLDTLKQYIKSRLLIDLQEQIKNSGPTLFLDIDEIRKTSFAVLIPSILYRKDEEIENTVSYLHDDGGIDLRPLWITSYGYDILRTANCGLVSTSEQYDEISKAFEELGYTLRFTRNQSQVEYGVIMSESMKEFVYYLVGSVFRYSIIIKNPIWKRIIDGKGT